MAGLEGQKVNTPEVTGLIAVAKDINTYVGSAADAIQKPSGSDAHTLVLIPENGNFRFQIGDTSGSLTATAPSAEITDGSGSILIKQDLPMTIPAPAEFTVIGSAADAILNYYWL